MACLIMASGSIVQAGDVSESRTFVGFEIESTKTNYTLNLNGVIPENLDNGSVVEYGARIGAENDEWRTTLLYTYYSDKDSGDEETMNKASLLIDYFFWNTDTGDVNIKPYIGAHVGYLSYKLTSDNLILGSNITIANDDGIFYGGQVGVEVLFSEVIGLDLSYKYSLTSISATPITLPNSNFDLDSMGSVVFSINYFF